LSTASVYPEGAATAFEMASNLGYDGVELMVWTDPVSQDVDQVADLSEQYNLPVLAIHAPCLLITQRVWSQDPWERLSMSVDAAQRLGASTVVVHPPFRWQRDYARDFVAGVARLEAESGVAIAVENMYPWRAAGREIAAYAPHWDPTDQQYSNNTLDLSHTAVSGTGLVITQPPTCLSRWWWRQPSPAVWGLSLPFRRCGVPRCRTSHQSAGVSQPVWMHPWSRWRSMRHSPAGTVRISGVDATGSPLPLTS
jgi:hypothetical protein